MMNLGFLRNLHFSRFKKNMMNLGFLRSTTNPDYLRQRLAECGENFDYLLSFPRAGNGWLRFVISLMVLEQRGINTAGAKIGTVNYDGVKGHSITGSDFQIGVDEIFPDVYIASRVEKLVFKPDPKLPLLKTHHVPPSNKGRLIYLYRDPIEAIPSCLHLAEPKWKESWNEKQILKTLRAIAECYNGLSIWVADNVAVRPKSEYIFVNLNDLRVYGETELGALLDWIGINYEAATLTRVLSQFPLRSGFDKQLMALHPSSVRAAVCVATKGYLEVLKLHRESW